MNSFKTKKGTELPLLNLRGKDYLQVAHRLVWFREEHPDWSILTELSSAGNDWAIFRATITNEKGFTIAQATKKEDLKGFADFIEKAETGAIGRALALCGYGTQFAPELEEGDRLADAPVARKDSLQSKIDDQLPQPAVLGVFDEMSGTGSAIGQFTVEFGKFRGKTLDQIGFNDAVSYKDYLIKKSNEDGKTPGGPVAAFISAVNEWAKE